MGISATAVARFGWKGMNRRVEPLVSAKCPHLLLDLVPLEESYACHCTIVL